MTHQGPSFVVILSCFVEGYLFTISAKLHVAISDERIFKVSNKVQERTTVIPEVFARTLFSQNFAYAKFRENKTLGMAKSRFRLLI